MDNGVYKSSNLMINNGWISLHNVVMEKMSEKENSFMKTSKPIYNLQWPTGSDLCRVAMSDPFCGDTLCITQFPV